MKMEERKLKQKVNAVFKMRGLIPRPESSRYLLQVLESVSLEDLEEVLEKVLDSIEKQPLSSSMVELCVVEAAVQDCSQSCDETIESVFNIIGAFDRTHRHELFSAPVAGSDPDQHRNKFQLKTVESLLGCSSKLGDVIVLGMITQLREGRFYLEDPSGWYEDGVLHISAFGFPPTEPSSFTRTYFGNLNFFGGPSRTAVKSSVKLQELEQQNQDAMMVILSDVWVDRAEVLESLHTLFSGYSAMPPTCFILCGNFSSAPYGTNRIRTLKDSFRALADLICEFPSIHNSSRFVFVPGPEDPGPSSVLPRPPLAQNITEEFTQKVPFSIFSTNPCRLQYCSQEMLVFREDLISKMCRNCVRLPSSSSLEVPGHLVRTVLSQGHLTPLALQVSPVHWAFDHAMRVYPVPDMIIFADKHDPFNITHTDCICINPGSFPRSGFSFKVYYPSSKTVEDRFGTHYIDATSNASMRLLAEKYQSQPQLLPDTAG
ncbi:hypothetical protein DNTS_030465, partial [Danionella cerebrum]